MEKNKLENYEVSGKNALHILCYFIFTYIHVFTCVEIQCYVQTEYVLSS